MVTHADIMACMQEEITEKSSACSAQIQAHIEYDEELTIHESLERWQDRKYPYAAYSRKQ